MQPDGLGPTDLRDLTYGEHVVLWAFRAMAVGRGDCALVRREFTQACGEAAGPARGALEIFVRHLALEGRRRVVLAPPGCLSITRDEQLVLALFAAAQARDPDRFAAHLSWLTAAPDTPFYYAAASATALALAEGGHQLRRPGAVARPVHDQPIPPARDLRVVARAAQGAAR